MPDRRSSFNSLTQQQIRVKITDIGASPFEGRPPYAPMLEAGDADIVGFEPNPAALAKLNQTKRPCETYLPHAIGDGTRRNLNFCRASGMTSLLTPNPKILALFHGFANWGKVVSIEPVDTVCLDDVAETAGTDLLKMDIQGAELMVLRHAENRLADLLVIQAEVEFLEMYIDQPLFSDVDIFLRQHNFVLHRFYPEVSRAIRPMLVNQDIYSGLGQLLWADAVFVRDFSRLEMISTEQLRKFAAIMHDCYSAFDLVLHLVSEVDRRTGADLATRYLAGLQMQPA